MGIVVENPGIQTTVQDEGRFGYQQYGVSPAGPMDTKSFSLPIFWREIREGRAPLR